MRPRLRRCLPAIALLLAACGRGTPPSLPAPEPDFAGLIARLSEEGGFFPSDNLVSNETSYLHVLGRMHAMTVHGGAYVGVGPDQNFSYIAAVRPEIAFLIDIRRDNLLHHLLFKALFERARNRVEYLALATGRPPPRNLREWNDADIERIVRYIDDTLPDSAYFERSARTVQETVTRWGVPLTFADLRVIRRIHEALRRHGLDLRYAQVPRYPTWRHLILETDLAGRRRNYLASDSAFRFIQQLQRRNLIVPVVGDLAGTHALAAIGDEVRSRGLTISVLYVSNVEQYLMRGGTFPVFAENVTGLPVAGNSVIVRSYFGRGRSPRLPQTMIGHYSTQLLERSTDFVNEYHAGGYRSYIELVTKNALPLDTAKASSG